MKNLLATKLLAALVAVFALGISTANSQTPRPEYPRPQFERSTWQNLNGTWTYTFDFGLSGADRAFKTPSRLTEKSRCPSAPKAN